MNESVLIVDDSLTVRMDLAEACESSGFRALLAASIADAHRILERETVSVIILDVILPDGDGVALLEELRRTPATKHTPILMLTSEVDVKHRVENLTPAADEYVGKPYDRGFVMERARELLERRPSILVIDDSPTFRAELGRVLERVGYRVLEAANGEEGLRVAAAKRPAGIIVDGIMPGIDGGTVIRRIRLEAALRRTPCVLLTASEDQGAELRALDSGADAFAKKGEDLEVILARLNAILRTAGSDAENGAGHARPKRILAVDDSLTFRHELAIMLEQDGYQVLLAESGEEALETLSREQVDCILLDLLMPGLGGQETCRRIKSSPAARDIPLIMLTALEDRQAMIDGLSAGADDYISKSSEREVLKARVRAQIRRKHFEDEHRDVREALLRSEAKAALAEEVEKKNKELEAFSYSVSHDLRAPLRTIDGFSQAVLEDYADKLDEQGRDYLQRIRSSAQRMGQLIDDLLELSRVTRAPFKRTQVDLSKITRAILSELQQREPQREVIVSVADEIVAAADAGLMRVVLENLLGNAWKFTAKTTPARIELGVERHEGDTIYFVRDNGAGFNMAYADRLFTPFQRLHSESDFAGTGIGLATVRRIVERHGGRVWAEGKKDLGATIFFTIGAATSRGRS